MPLGAFKAALMGTAGATAAGDVVLLSTQTASNSATIDFSSGITSTYGEYIFKWYNINPATDNANFSFQVNATDDDGGDYDASVITSQYMHSYHDEADSSANIGYETGNDLAQAASFQILNDGQGNGSDESSAGELHLFNPSSTTYIKHFYSRCQSYNSDNSADDVFVGGYINDTTAIDDVRFKMSSGNFDGKIKMWGVK